MVGMKKWLWVLVLVPIAVAGVLLLYPLAINNGTALSGDQYSEEVGVVKGIETTQESLTTDLQQPELTREDEIRLGLEAVASDMYFVYDGKTIVLSSLDVQSFLRSDCRASDDDCVSVIPCVDIEATQTYINDRLHSMLVGQLVVSEARNKNGSYLYSVSDWSLDEGTLLKDVVENLSTRISGYRRGVCEFGPDGVASIKELQRNPVIWVLKKESPGTDGQYASRYIEIDNSQQHLYLWQDGNVIKDYEISGFYDEYAVYGVFSIVNKSTNAWSSIAKKWMPWWMAYYYDDRQNAWLGIHELVYWTDANGVYHEESSDSIGKKKSGGCIRLDRGPAKEFYDLIDVGTPVLIHE
jgi:hypothetical protein